MIDDRATRFQYNNRPGWIFSLTRGSYEYSEQRIWYVGTILGQKFAEELITKAANNLNVSVNSKGNCDDYNVSSLGTLIFFVTEKNGKDTLLKMYNTFN